MKLYRVRLGFRWFFVVAEQASQAKQMVIDSVGSVMDWHQDQWNEVQVYEYPLDHSYVLPLDTNDDNRQGVPVPR